MKPILRLLILALLLTHAVALLAQRYGVTHMGRNVNTPGGESGAVMVGDSLLLYSSIQSLAAHRHSFIDFDQYLMQVFQAPVGRDGRVGKGRLSPLDFNSQTLHSGNVSYDPQEPAYYFTRCSESEEGYRCQIYVMRRSGSRWLRAEPLPSPINLPGYTSTQPSVGRLPDGSPILYFSSDRPGGQGGLDLWYVLLAGPTLQCVNLGPVVNSPADEITPFYHAPSRTLYFSSDREGALGGYDVFSSKGSRNTWQTPRQLPQPINGPYNDIYFSVNPNDASHGYMASNREDSFFLTDSSCCSDLYRWHLMAETGPDEESRQEPLCAEPTIEPSREKCSDTLFPISLYFHNDEPDPGSQSDTTLTTYFQTYNSYMFLRSRYLECQPDDSMRREADRFFEEEIQGSCRRFERMLVRMASELASGRRLDLLVAGYASPLHSAEYNQRLARRRTATIINQIAAFRGGMLAPYLGRTLTVRIVSYGSSKAVRSQADPVYSVDAMRERRIEIIGLEVSR